MQSKLFQTASAILPFCCLKPIQNVFGHSSASSEGTCGRWRIWAPSNRNCISQRVLDLFLHFVWCFRVLVFENKMLVWYNKMIKKIMWPAPKHFPLRCCFCFGGIAGISWSHPNSIPASRPLSLLSQKTQPLGCLVSVESDGPIPSGLNLFGDFSLGAER